MSKYPLLTEMLHELHIDSYGSGVELPEDQWIWPKNAARLEKLAAKMTADERVLFVNGEGSEVAELIAKYKLEALDKFLGDVVEGDLTTNFWNLES